MNVYELDGYTLSLLYEDDSDAARTLYSAGFLQSYNKAYMEIQRTKYRPVMWEEETLTNNAFLMSALSRRCRGIIKVSQYQDYSTDAGGYQSPAIGFITDGLYIRLPNGYAESTAWVQYYHLCPDLANAAPTVAPETADETNTPQIPDESHVLLASMAAADFCRARKKEDRVESHMAEYYRVLRTLQPYEANSPARQFKNTLRSFSGWK